MPKNKLLIIEDDRSLADVVEYNFSQSGYEVFCARDGQDGINQARSRLPDIILLDLMIPVIDGIEVCRQLRAESATRETPIIMVTAKSEEVDQLIGFSVGADDYVIKPFSVRVLLEKVKTVLRRHARSKGAGLDIVSSGPVEVINESAVLPSKAALAVGAEPASVVTKFATARLPGTMPTNCGPN